MNTEWIELKGITDVATAVAAGMEIEARYLGSWCPWKGASWGVDVLYRARPRKPAKVQVKSICWRATTEEGALIWRAAGYDIPSILWQRFPAGDMEGEVES